MRALKASVGERNWLEGGREKREGKEDMRIIELYKPHRENRFFFVSLCQKEDERKRDKISSSLFSENESLSLSVSLCVRYKNYNCSHVYLTGDICQNTQRVSR